MFERQFQNNFLQSKKEPPEVQNNSGSQTTIFPVLLRIGVCFWPSQGPTPPTPKTTSSLWTLRQKLRRLHQMTFFLCTCLTTMKRSFRRPIRVLSIATVSASYRIEKPRDPENRRKIGKIQDKLERNGPRIGFFIFCQFSLEFGVCLFCSWPTRSGP